MFESIKVIFHQVSEALAEGGARAIFRPRVFRNRLATPVEMDLTTISGPLNNDEFQFVELTIDDLQTREWSFAVPSRGLKALRNLKRGFRSFAVLKESIVIGDVWCIAPQKDGSCISHPDLKMLDIRCGTGEAYAFDMFIHSTYRGRNLAVPLQKSLQAALKMEGCQKVYGYYWNDNLPALWMHRMLKFKELPKRRVSRFFFLIKSDKEMV